MTNYKGYEFVCSGGRGGKAGRGKGKTRSLQIRTIPRPDGSYFLKKQIRYTPSEAGSLERTVEKAKAWVASAAPASATMIQLPKPKPVTGISFQGREDEMLTFHKDGKFWMTLYAPSPEDADELESWLSKLQNK